MSDRQLKLGAILSGVGTTQNGGRHPELAGDASIDIDWFRDNARKAEAAKFDLVFIVDSPYITADSAPHFLNRLEPLTLLSAVATATSRIGLVATLTTSYTEPFNVARHAGARPGTLRTPAHFIRAAIAATWTIRSCQPRPTARSRRLDW